MSSKPVQDPTIRDLAGIIRDLEPLPSDSKRFADLHEPMPMASLCLEDSGTLARLLWWAPDLKPDAPPDARAKIFVMPRTNSFSQSSP